MVSPPLPSPACMCGVAYGSACRGKACGKSLKYHDINVANYKHYNWSCEQKLLYVLDEKGGVG